RHPHGGQALFLGARRPRPRVHLQGSVGAHARLPRGLRRADDVRLAAAREMTGVARVAVETIDQPEALALVAELDAHLEPLYPPESRHGLTVDGLRAPNVYFVLARDAAGRAMGCGAVMHAEGYAELK